MMSKSHRLLILEFLLKGCYAIYATSDGSLTSGQWIFLGFMQRREIDWYVISRADSRRRVNEIWRESRHVVVRMTVRLITFGLAVALILTLCKIHCLSVSPLDRLSPHAPSLPLCVSHTPTQTHVCTNRRAHRNRLTPSPLQMHQRKVRTHTNKQSNRHL